MVNNIIFSLCVLAVKEIIAPSSNCIGFFFPSLLPFLKYASSTEHMLENNVWEIEQNKRDHACLYMYFVRQSRRRLFSVIIMLNVGYVLLPEIAYQFFYKKSTNILK